jgi:hypothetical protein
MKKRNVQELPLDMRGDPLKIRQRVYRQYGRLLNMMEETEMGDEDGMTIPQLIAALKALNDYDLKTVQGASGGSDKPAGAAVRKYAAAFKNAGSGRKAGSGRAAEPDPSELPDDDDTAA